MTDDPDPPVIPTPPPDPNSILGNIKKMLGVDVNDDAFDVDIMIHINSVFMSLNQLGVGPENVFSISGYAEVWTDFLADTTKVSAIKSYIYQKARLLFDPPTSSTLLDAITRQITEFEWRLNVQAEQGLYTIPPVVIVEGEEGYEY